VIIVSPTDDPILIFTATPEQAPVRPLSPTPTSTRSSQSDSDLEWGFASPSKITDFRPLVHLLHAQHAVGQAEVPWSALASSLFHLHNKSSRFTQLIKNAVAAGVVEIGGVGTTGFTEWAKLARSVSPRDFTSAARPTSPQSNDPDAIAPVTAVSSRFRPLVIQLQTRQALGQAKVKSSVLRTNLHHLFTSKTELKKLIKDAVADGVIVMGEVGNNELEWAELVISSQFVYS